MQVNICLKDGATFLAECSDDRTFTAESLTEDTIQTFIDKDRKQKLVVQGNNILYMLVELP